jgi:hypothetical protein
MPLHDKHWHKKIVRNPWVLGIVIHAGKEFLILLYHLPVCYQCFTGIFVIDVLVLEQQYFSAVLSITVHNNIINVL